MDGTFERYACEFRAAHLVSPLTHTSHGSFLKIHCRQRQHSSKLFCSFSSRIVMHGSGSIVIITKGWLTTRRAQPNTSVSTRPLYFTFGIAITLNIIYIYNIMLSGPSSGILLGLKATKVFEDHSGSICSHLFQR